MWTTVALHPFFHKFLHFRHHTRCICCVFAHNGANMWVHICVLGWKKVHKRSLESMDTRKMPINWRIQKRKETGKTDKHLKAQRMEDSYSKGRICTFFHRWLQTKSRWVVYTEKTSFTDTYTQLRSYPTVPSPPASISWYRSRTINWCRGQEELKRGNWNWRIFTTVMQDTHKKILVEFLDMFWTISSWCWKKPLLIWEICLHNPERIFLSPS